MPATTPSNLRADTGSWRVIAAVKRNVKIGDVALRMAAGPASTDRSAQAMSVNGMTLLRHAWNRKRRQVGASLGEVNPRHLMIATRIDPAIKVRAAIIVTGGMVATAILMK